MSAVMSNDDTTTTSTATATTTDASPGATSATANVPPVPPPVPPPPVYARVGSYDLIRTIGHGNFSVCKLAEHRHTSERFAIKCIQKKNLDPYNLTRVYREIEIMKSLDHPNIIKLHQVCFSIFF